MYFTEEHQLFREGFRSFLTQEVVPHIEKWEKSGTIDRFIWEKFGEMGYFGLNQPEAYGGLDLDLFYTVIFLEELQRINSGGFAAAMWAHAYLAMTHLKAEGSPVIKEKYLAQSIAGKMIGCLCISEPFAGSDVAGMRTTAIKKGDKSSISELIKYIRKGSYNTDEQKLRAALEYIRFYRYTKYFETILAYRAEITSGIVKQKCNSNFYGIYEYDSQVVNDLRAFCDEFDIDYDVIMVQPRYDGKLDDLLLKGNARIGLRFNTTPNLYFFDFNQNMTLERFPAILENAETYIGSVRKRKKIEQLTRGKLTSTTAEENVFQEKINLTLTEDKKGFNVERQKSASGHFEDRYMFNWIHFTDFLKEDYEKYPEVDHFYQCGSKKEIQRQTEQFKAFEQKKYDEFIENREEDLDEEWEDGTVSDLTSELIESGRYGINVPLSVKETFLLKDGYIKNAGKNIIIEIGKFIGGQVEIEEKERDRKANIYLDYAKTFNYHIRLNIPDGYSVKGIEKLNIDVENSTGSFKAEASLEGNVLVIKTTKVYKNNFVENKDWAAMTEWLDAAYEFGQSKVLLQK